MDNNYKGDKDNVPKTNFLFDEVPSVEIDPLIIVRKLSFRERLLGKVVDEVPQTKPKFGEDIPSDPSSLRSLLGEVYGTINAENAIILYRGTGKGIALTEDPAILALEHPRHNPPLARAFEELEAQYHEIVLKLPKGVRVNRKQKAHYTKLVKELINNDARTVIYTPSR